MKGLLKKLTGLLFVIACVAFVKSDVYAGTGIYVGKDVSREGTALIGASTEVEFGMSVVPEVIEKGSFKKGDVIECLNGYRYTMPEDSAKVTLLKLMSYTGYGNWNSCASNEYGVSVVSVLTTSANVDAQVADPFVTDGMSEQNLSLILASTSKTARQAVELLCQIYEEKGAESAETVLIADSDGAWIVENFTGHQYVATKLPDDRMATFSNDPVIRTADPEDPDTICSSKLFTLPEEKGFAVYDKDKNIDLILTYNKDNSYVDEHHIRGWVGHDIFAPSEELDYDVDEDYDMFFVPDSKVSIRQAFDFFRNRFEGTAFDLADEDNDYYWGINNQTVCNVSLIQVFDDVPDEISSVIWTTPANPTASPFIPIPAYANEIPESFSTDVENDEYEEGILQFDFAKLNSNIYSRRKLYGSSVREYWEGMEAISANDVADSVRGKWNDAFNESPEKTIGEVNDYVAKIVNGAQENCIRLNDELEWYFFKNGMHKTSVPDDELQKFECSFDAVSYAHSNGWETKIEGDVFTAVKDGRTIEVVFDGENKGDITFTGFDNKKLKEDFLGDDTEDEDVSVDLDTVEEEEEEAEKEASLEQKLSEEIEEEKKETKETKETTETVNKEETEKEETVDTDAVDEIKKTASKQIEVDTIAELEDYFAEKIADIPRDGWAENEIARELGDVSKGVAGIITRHFEIDPADLLTMDYEKKGSEVVNDPALKKAGDEIVEAGLDLSALSEKYFTSLYEDVSDDIVSGRLSQEGAIKILNEAETDIEGIARLYLEGLEGAFAGVFDTEMSDEEFAEILGELGEGAISVMDDYGLVDLDELGLDGIDIDDLTEADIDVVITLNEMDDDVIDGLSDILGVDVRSKLDEYMEALAKDGGNTKLVVEEIVNEFANEEPSEEIKAVTELEETLTDEDIEIPQEVIDILREAIREASGETAEEELPAEEAEDAGSTNEPFTINVPGVVKTGQKVMLPANMLKYFN